MDIDTMTAGSEMDALIAEKVMGWMWVYKTGWELAGYPVFDKLPFDAIEYDDSDYAITPYSTDIAAAWQVVEKVFDNFAAWMTVGNNPDFMRYRGKYFSTVHGGKLEYDSPSCNITCYADTAPLAICRAALKAIEASVKTK